MIPLRHIGIRMQQLVLFFQLLLMAHFQRGHHGLSVQNRAREKQSQEMSYPRALTHVFVERELVIIHHRRIVENHAQVIQSW